MAAQLESTGPNGSSGPQASPAAAIPDHALLGLIGKGSYGEIWLARNTLGSYRAVKIVHASTFRDKRPFERELSGVQKFEPVSRLHEGLVDILQVGRNLEAGYFYCVMELADDVAAGQTISPDHYTPRTLAQQIAKDKRVPIDICLQVGITICSALVFLHSRGLIHRDIKPSNIVFVQGVPKLADIGLVVEMTEARSYVGTEGFIPPEGPGTVQADLYSLGKVLYEMSTGKDRHDYPELPTLLDETEQSRQLLQLNKVILKACRTNPRERYRSAAEMLADLQAVQQGKPVRMESRARRRLKRLAQAATVLVGLGLLAACLRFGSKPSAQAEFPTGAVPAPAGLVSWWRGESNSLDTVQVHSNLLVNQVGFSAGKVGQALSFTDNQSFIEVADAPYLRLTNELTIEFWLKRQQLHLLDCVVEKGGDWTGGELNYAVGANCEETGNCLVFSFACGWRGAGRIADLNWHHCAVVVRHGQLDPEFYIDGVEQPVEYRGGAERIQLYPSTKPLHIGAQIDHVTSHHYCSPKLVDELAIYSRALTAAEIQMIAGSASAGKRPGPSSLTAAGSASPPGFALGQAVVAPAGLISWWRAEGTAQDSAGTNHGLLVHAGFAPGKVGQGFFFQGTNSYICIPHSASLSPSNELTVELWYKDLGTRGLCGLVAKRAPYPGGCNFGINMFPDGPNGIQVYFKDAASEFYQLNAYSPVPQPGGFHHLAGVFRQVNVSEVELKTFLDGRNVKTARILGHLAEAQNEVPLTLGADNPREDFFYGIIDEVSLYNRALTDAEIESIYHAGSAGKQWEPRPAAKL